MTYEWCFLSCAFQTTVFFQENVLKRNNQISHENTFIISPAKDLPCMGSWANLSLPATASLPTFSVLCTYTLSPWIWASLYHFHVCSAVHCMSVSCYTSWLQQSISACESLASRYKFGAKIKRYFTFISKFSSLPIPLLLAGKTAILPELL